MGPRPPGRQQSGPQQRPGGGGEAGGTSRCMRQPHRHPTWRRAASPFNKTKQWALPCRCRRCSAAAPACSRCKQRPDSGCRDGGRHSRWPWSSLSAAAPSSSKLLASAPSPSGAASSAAASAGEMSVCTSKRGLEGSRTSSLMGAVGMLPSAAGQAAHRGLHGRTSTAPAGVVHRRRGSCAEALPTPAVGGGGGMVHARLHRRTRCYHSMPPQVALQWLRCRQTLVCTHTNGGSGCLGRCTDCATVGREAPGRALQCVHSKHSQQGVCSSSW